jgi:hypothetical protein
MLINWNYYVIKLTFDGSRFAARRLDDDRKWIRRGRGRWDTCYGCEERDTELVAALEQGISEWQPPTPRPERGRGPRAPILPPLREPIRKSREPRDRRQS